jgi:antitoxin HigA-1
MAVRLGKFCGNGPDLWLRMQEAYDLWQAEKKLAREVRHIRTVPSGMWLEFARRDLRAR